jgi:small basic protein
VTSFIMAQQTSRLHRLLTLLDSIHIHLLHAFSTRFFLSSFICLVILSHGMLMVGQVILGVDS